MRVLHICTRDQRGGAEQFAFDMVNHSKDGAHLLVKKKITNSPKVIQIKRAFLGTFTDLLNQLTYKIFSRALFADIAVIHNLNQTYHKLKKLQIYQDADIIHLHNLHGEYFDFNALINIAKDKPLIWTLHDMWSFTGGEAYTINNTNYQKGIPFTPFNKYYPLLNSFFDKRETYFNIKKNVYNQIKNKLTFVPVSFWLEGCLNKAHVIPEGFTCNTIRNGIDIKTFKNLGRRNWEKPRILFFNSDNEFKGCQLVINSIDKIQNDYDLYVLGKDFTSSISKKFFPRITNREELNNFYNEVDILLFPSEAENFPLIVLEAMSAGVYIIGANTGGITEQINEAGGVLFESGNQQDMLSKIDKTLALDINKIRKRGEQSGRYICNNLSLENMYKKYCQLYEEILGKTDN